MATKTSKATKAMGSLSLATPKAAAPKQKQKAVLDSWEDESSGSEHEPPTPTTATEARAAADDDDSDKPPAPSSGFSAPPPTPASPRNFGADAPWPQQSTAAAGGEWGGPRPEKTDAVARRMIAGALGVRAPRPTEEQRAYDRAVREKERRRREEEREAERRRQEEAERAKAAIWDD